MAIAVDTSSQFDEPPVSPTWVQLGMEASHGPTQCGPLQKEVDHIQQLGSAVLDLGLCDNQTHGVLDSQPDGDNPALTTQAVAQVRNMSPAIVGSPTVQPVTVQEFIAGLKLPLEQP